MPYVSFNRYVNFKNVRISTEAWYMLVFKRTAKITRAKGLHTPVSAAFLLAVAFVKHVIFALLEDGSFLHGLYDTVFHDSGKWAMSCSFIARYAYM